MRRANTACAQVSRISTQSKRLTRGHRLSTPPHTFFPAPSFDSILPFLSLNTLPLAKLQHSFTPPSPNSPTSLSVLPSRCLSSLLLFIPREFHHAQSFSIFHVFYLSTEERTCEPFPNKGKTPSCHLRKCCRVEGDRQQGQSQVDSMESGMKKREMVGKRNRNMKWKVEHFPLSRVKHAKHGPFLAAHIKQQNLSKAITPLRTTHPPFERRAPVPTIKSDSCTKHKNSQHTCEHKNIRLSRMTSSASHGYSL